MSAVQFIAYIFKICKEPVGVDPLKQMMPTPLSPQP